MGGNNSSSTFAGVISGSGSLIKSGPGIDTVSGANAYTGTTSINGGTLQLGAPTSIGSASAVTVAGGATFDLNGFAETAASVAGSGNISLGNGGALSEGADNTSTQFSGVISGTGSVTKAGTGTLSLTGANTFSGSVAVTAGTLSIDTDARFGNFSNGVTLAGGTLQAVATFSSSRTITLGAASTINTGGNSVTLLGAIGGGGSLTKAGTGSLFS